MSIPILKFRLFFLILSLVFIFALGAFAPSRALAAYDVPENDGAIPDDTGASGDSGGTVSFRNPLGIDTIQDLVDHISDWLFGIVAGVAVLMIMYAGFKYATSSGEQGEVKKAKEIIQNAVKGLIIVFGVNIIIDEINYLMGITSSSSSFFDFSNRAIVWLFSIIVGISVLAIIYAGYLFMSKGDVQAERKKAQDIIQYTVIGIAVASLAAVIVKIVIEIF